MSPRACIAWAETHPLGCPLALALLLLGAFGLLSVGAAEHTGITGKDEYYLSLRTPLCMREQQVWLVPCLDGEPRLRKPPLVYWLTRASFELFGPSLRSARLVAVALAATLVLAVALIALELGDGLRRALEAGLMALSCLSLSVGGRMLELDVPVAACSALACYWLLRWYRRAQSWAAPLGALWLAAGFLTKGPVVLVVCGAGALALLATDPQARTFLRHHWPGTLGVVTLAALLALPWFLYVAIRYPAASASVLDSELGARRFLQVSMIPLSGGLLLALPWSFVVLLRIAVPGTADARTRQRLHMRALWLGFTLLPFFFLRSFERYLFGSLVPLALLLALPLEIGPAWRWAARLGLALTLPAALAVQIGALLLAGPAPALGLGIPATGWYLQQWWQAQHKVPMALSAALLWTCTLGLAYPRLGINQVPPALLAQARGRDIVFYNGPQPGLLPALLGRSLVHVDGRWHLPQGLRGPCAEFLVLVEAHQAADALAGIERLELKATEQGRYGVFSSRVSWANMLRSDLTRSELLAALGRGDLERLKPQVLLYQVRDPRCPAG